MADPIFDAEINILGLIRLLEACTRSGVQKVALLLLRRRLLRRAGRLPRARVPSAAPGEPLRHVQGGWRALPGLLQDEKKLPFIALRYANVYGPRQDPHGEAGVVGIFCERLLRGAPCAIYGDGENTRDFVFVGDVARANVLALQSDYIGPVNIGTGRETSVNELHERLASVAGVKAAPLHVPPRPGEQRRSVIDATLAARVLGWRAETPLEEGLKKTLVWLRATAGSK